MYSKYKNRSASIVSSILMICYLLFYIYSITFHFFPFVTTKVVLAGFGLLMYLTDNKKRIYSFIPLAFTKSFNALFLVLILSFISFFINEGGELIHFRTIASFLSSIFASYFIYRYAKRFCLDIESFLFLIVIAIFFESLLTVLMRVMPVVHDVIGSIILINVKQDHIDVVHNLKRLIGIGEASYFGVIPSATLGIFSSMYLALWGRYNKAFIFIIYFTIAIVSFLVARVSIVPIFFSLLLFIYYFRNNIKSGLFIVTSIFTLSIIIIPWLISLIPENMFIWASEVFFSNGPGGSKTNSIDDLLYVINRDKSFDFYTFIIGDCRYTDPITIYYKATDVGYMRQIFYGGCVGLVLLLFSQYSMVRVVCKYCNNINLCSMINLIFLSYLIVLVKGDIMYFDIYSLIGIFIYFSKNEHLYD